MIQTVAHSDSLHRREKMRFHLRYSVRRISKTHPDGTTAEIKIIRGNHVYAHPTFAEGSAEFEGRSSNGQRFRVRMVDDEYESVTENPVYFELTEANGDRFYLHARGGPGTPFGAFVFWFSAEGEMKTREDFGIFLETDPDGTLRAVRTPHRLALLEDEEHGGYQLRVYRELPHVDDVLPDNRFLPPENTVPYEHYRYIKPETPGKTGLLAEKILPEQPYRWARWVENPIGDYDLYYDDENGEVYLEIAVRRYTRNPRNFIRTHGQILRGGQRRVTTTERTVIGGSWKNIRQEIDLEGDVTVWTYTYWDEPVPRDFELKTRVSSKGPWAAFDYDIIGRLEVEIRPVETTRQVVEYVPEETPGDGPGALDAFLAAFTDGAPEGKRRVSREVVEYDPPAPPEDIREGTKRGEVTLHEYAHPDPSVNRDPEDDRPAVTTLLRHGEFVKRTWIKYDVEQDGKKVTRRVTTQDENATHDDPRNTVTFQ